MDEFSIKTQPQQFIRIDDPDIPIYRIFKVRHLEKMLSERQMVLASPSSWDDPFETIVGKIQVEWRDEGILKQKIINQSLPQSYAQCWSRNNESDTMLRAYSRVVKDPKTQLNICLENEGVRVKSTPRKLLEALLANTQYQQNTSCLIGAVDYYNQENLLQQIANEIGRFGTRIFEEPMNRALLLLMKRKAYSHEEEIRLLVIHHVSDSPDDIMKIDIDPNAIFDEIVFDPRLTNAEKIKRESLFKELGYTGKVVRSSLHDKLFLTIQLEKPPRV